MKVSIVVKVVRSLFLVFIKNQIALYRHKQTLVNEDHLPYELFMRF